MYMRPDINNLSFFDTPGQEQISLDHTGGKLDVVRAEFLAAETLSWEELFDGFNQMYAITYSSGMDFICKLLKKFDQAEIIFGFDEVISYSLQEVMAYQLKTVERLREKASKNKLDLMSRIDDGSLRLLVARKQLSHEKIYLLKADDGRRRVVMGSANLSHSAFSGSQRENISYMD
ncbi:MAG: phospholipase D family protein, partial [Eubacteriales bacterium]|nr:phospholipase D family protein [Eubacteriales bacterium]